VKKKSLPTSPLGTAPNPGFIKALELINELTVSELQSIIIETAFLIRTKAVAELLTMLRTAQEKEEQDAKSSDNNQS
jgi:hypothetical protein